MLALYLAMPPSLSLTLRSFMPMQGWWRKSRKDMDTYTYPVVVSAVNVSGHAKVSDLNQQVFAHQAVPVGAARGLRHGPYLRYDILTWWG